MENRDFFKGIFDDFFGIEKLRKENEELAKELNLNDDYPIIEVKKTEEQQNEETKKLDKNEFMASLYEKIDELYILEESKDTLKKIIEYMRKYNEKIEKQYIPFNMCIYSNNNETVSLVTSIISEAANFFNYVKAGALKTESLYNIEKIEQIEALYNAKNNIIVLKDFEVISNQDKMFKDKILYKIEENIEKNQYITILVSKNKETLNQLLEQYTKISNNFEFEIIAINPDVQDVYKEILDKLKKNNEVSDEFSIKLLDYISVTYPNTELSYPEYRDKLYNKIIFNKKEKLIEEDIPEYQKEKTIEEIFNELNSLVGLDNVKQVLKDLVSLIELKNKTKNELNIKDTNLHMVFLGNPGTGKTTVARIISQILYNLKYIKQDKLIEVSSKDLVAEYVGQTAPKTMAVIEKALGGVLFIDEAYSLASGNGQGNSYNEEAIATLIQAMENYRDNLVVIFAGYTKEMQAFLNANSGIVSRIGYTLDFKDYTEEELLKIFESMVKKSGFDVNQDALDEVIRVIKEYKNTKNFGNARFIRNLYEKTVIKHAANTKGKKSKKILKTITKKDISTENLIKM